MTATVEIIDKCNGGKMEVNIKGIFLLWQIRNFLKADLTQQLEIRGVDKHI